MRVLVVHPWMSPIGGAELVSLHVIARLVEKWDADVTLLTFAPPDWQDVVSSTGLSLATRRVSTLIPRTLRLANMLPGKITLLRVAVAQRIAQRMAGRFDLCISTFGEINFGRRGIQYVHHPLFGSRDVLHKYKILPPDNWPKKTKLLTTFYDRIISFISRIGVEDIHQNVTLTNSRFMQKVLIEAAGMRSQVLYPSLITPPLKTEHQERAPFQFLNIGRIAPDKHHSLLLDIFYYILLEVPEASLVVAGSTPDVSYLERLRTEIRSRDLPVEVRTNLPRREIERLLAHSTYYLHAKPYEHFGISVLEAMKWGCLPVVHATGGPVELLPWKELQFSTPQEAAMRVARLVESPERRRDLLERVASRAREFNIESFYAGLDAAIGTVLGKSTLRAAWRRIQDSPPNSTETPARPGERAS